MAWSWPTPEVELWVTLRRFNYVYGMEWAMTNQKDACSDENRDKEANCSEKHYLLVAR